MLAPPGWRSPNIFQRPGILPLETGISGWGVTQNDVGPSRAKNGQELSQSFTSSSWMTLGTTSGRRFPKKLAAPTWAQKIFPSFVSMEDWKRWTKYITKSGWSKQMFMVYLNDQRVPCCNRALSHQQWKFMQYFLHGTHILWEARSFSLLWFHFVPEGTEKGEKNEWWLGWVENLSLCLVCCCTTSRLDEKTDLGHTGPCELCHVTSH